MKIESTSAEMLAVCRTDIATADNMSLMGLGTKAIGTVQKMNKPQSCGSTCSNCTQWHTLGREHCPAKDSICHRCQNVGDWKQKCRKSNKAKDYNKISKWQFCRQPGARKRAYEVGVSDRHPAFDEITIHA